MIRIELSARGLLLSHCLWYVSDCNIYISLSMFVVFFLGAQCECLSLLSRFVFVLWRRNVEERFTFTHCLYDYRVCKIGNYHYVMSFSERVCVVCVCVAACPFV